MKLRLFAEKPCPKHNLLAFWIGSDIYCKACLAEMEPEHRKALCDFWAELILTAGGGLGGNKKDIDG